MGSWLSSAHSSGSTICLKVAQIAQTCKLEDPEWEVSATPPNTWGVPFVCYVGT